MAMDKDKKGFIRYLKHSENLSVSEIAKRVGADRKTVRRALDDNENKKRRKRVSKLDPFKKRIGQIIDENPKLSNVLILEKIKQEGYAGGKSILGDYLLKIRNKNKEAFNHIETLPGAEAQVDWAGCGTISCGNYSRKLYLFCMVLSFSRYMYATFTTSMDSDTFMACHIKAFRFFGLSGSQTGGVPKSLLYDNLKSVVSFRYGKEIIFNERFSDFALYYGFKIKVCNVRRGNEKGKVERAIRYIKENFLIRKEYENLSQIKSELSLWLRESANRRIHSATRKKPADMLNEERDFFLILPQTDYDYPNPRPARPRKDCLFSFDANRYSIPAEYYNKALLFKAYTDKITVVCEDEVVAVHKRCYDKYQIIKNPAHYAALNERKTKARQSESIERFKALCPEAESYLKGLMKNQVNVQFHINKILSLEQIFGTTALTGAIAGALPFGAFHWEFIKNILFNGQRPVAAPQPTLADKQALMNIRVKAPDLSQYDALTEKGGGK